MSHTLLPPARSRPTAERVTRRRGWLPVAGLMAIASALVLGWPRPALWLDEAQSVAIARKSVGGIVEALRADGAPPVYYLLLHVWMTLFGDGDVAVRSLSIVCGVAAVGVLALLATRLWGTRAATVIVLLTISHPFFVRYATETRMYALVMLEVALAALAVEAWLRTRRRRWLVVWGLMCWSLPLTHYWGISLVLASAACLFAGAVWSGRTRDARSLRLSAAVALAALLATAVWWPVLRFQAQHTGTPWTRPSGPGRALVVAFHRGIGGTIPACLITVALALLAAVGAAAAWTHLTRPGTAVPSRGPGRLLSSVLIATLVLSFLVTRVTSSGFVARYAMTTFPPQMLLATFGAILLLRARAHWAAAVVWGISISVSAGQADAPRTRAPMFAEALTTESVSGDVVLYCPDQLGPPLARLLDDRRPDLRQWTYPEFASPDRVDWIDYRQRHERASPSRFAQEAARRAGRHDIWLVLSITHPPTQEACAALADGLRTIRPDVETTVADDPDWPEHDSLLRYRSTTPAIEP